jgi:LacI family transcriptional regulator
LQLAKEAKEKHIEGHHTCFRKQGPEPGIISYCLKNKKSIHDLAKELNLSATTISFVLNGKAEEKRISTSVQEKVNAYIRETGYQPNMVAKSLRTGKTQIVGMLVEDISDPFFSSIARGIEETLYNKGYKIFYSSTENKPEKAKELLRIFRERQVDAYIVAPTPNIEDEVMALMKEGKPVILFDRYFPNLSTNNVVVDNYGGAQMAIEHLVKNGFSKIGFVTLESQQIQMQERMNGYKDSVKNYSIKESIETIPYNLDTARIASRVKAFIQKNSKLDAILFATNYLAVAGMHAIRELGLNIPDDIALVGFDDNTHFALFSPSITAIAQPIEGISESITEMLDSYLQKQVTEAVGQTVRLPVELIVRDSSKPRNI